jgi:hypothetical protein
MCSDDEEGAGGADAKISRRWTPRTAGGNLAAAPPSTGDAAAAAGPMAKRPRVELLPAANASARVVRSLADLVDAESHRGANLFAPLHRVEQAAIVIQLATAELTAVLENGAAAAAACAAAAPSSARDGGGGSAPRSALGDVGAQRRRLGSGACGDDTPAQQTLRDWTGEERRWTR